MSSLTTVVPEPSTCLLFCVGTLAWFRSGRRLSKPCNPYFR
ncbi:MAG: PEP-CTERM sorting domain-containing protein [Planctomycetes bacterium]|nr:PEP-CTERM sorting domain-containing protein [Planctomycetota bacterium]